MRRKIVAANWKMNLNLAEAVHLAKDVRASESHYQCEIILFPSFVFLNDVAKELNGSTIALGAQNCSDKNAGAYTGEISAQMIASSGAAYVLVGHSERRLYNNETNFQLRDKIIQAMAAGLNVIFCCGEPLAIRGENRENEFVSRQLQETLFGLSAEQMKHIVIAYEPVWAIGTGLNATPLQAQDMHAYIRNQIAEKFGANHAAHLSILYGGSCKPDNAAELFACPDVDGGLIGGASLDANNFKAIIAAI